MYFGRKKVSVECVKYEMKGKKQAVWV